MKKNTFSKITQKSKQNEKEILFKKQRKMDLQD